MHMNVYAVTTFSAMFVSSISLATLIFYSSCVQINIRVYVYMCICICVYMYTCVYAYIHMYTYTHSYIYNDIYMHVYAASICSAMVSYISVARLFCAKETSLVQKRRAAERV